MVRTTSKPKNLSLKKFIKTGIVLLVCAYVACIFIKQQITLSRCDDRAAEMQTMIDEEKLENQRLSDELEQAGTDEYIQRAAREKLGLVKANERVFIDISQE